MRGTDADDFAPEPPLLKAAMNYDFTPAEVAAYYCGRVPQLKQSHAVEWRGACPVHNGKRDSFAVKPNTGLAYCHSQCARGWDIIGLEQELTGTDFKTAMGEVYRLVGRYESTNGSGHLSSRRIVTEYGYTDESGKLLYQVVRYEPKDFRQRRPNGKGGWEWNLQGVRLVPYRLPSVLKHQVVFVCEGERDVQTVESLQFTATCNPMGAGKWRSDYAEYFRQKHVVILPDNDDTGRKHAAAVAGNLLPVAKRVRIVEVPIGKDVSNWVSAGGSRAALEILVKDAPDITEASLAGWRAKHGIADLSPRATAHTEHAVAGVAVEWPLPVSLQGELPPVQAFSEHLLPDSFRPLLVDVAERMQVPLDYPAVVMVLCLAGAVNRRAMIQPKAHDTGWVVVPNLWGGIIAKPGLMKSAVIQATTRPLNQVQSEWLQEHEERLKDYARAKEEYDLRCAAWKEQYKAASKKGNTAPDRPEDEPEEPKLRRLIVNDATFEALHQTMSENPAGILVIRDELTGWWSQLDRAGREGERAFCLQAWNGDTGHTIDRIGRGTIHVEACCMSMLGGIQPGRLRSYLVDALKDGPSNDGLIQRFQLMVWPDMAPDWDYVDRAPDAASEQSAARVFRRLLEVDAENPLRFRFAPDAQELFIKWLAELEAKVRGDELHPALTSHLSKYRSLMPSLALLFELADAVVVGHWRDSVSVEHAGRAAAWCEYLESHARRVYSCVVTPQLRAARELSEKIKHRKVGAEGLFSCRDVYLKGWGGLDSPESVKQAVEVLQDAGWVRELSGESRPLGGRPSNRYEVNPRLWE